MIENEKKEYHPKSKLLMRILLAGVIAIIIISFIWGIYLFRIMIGMEKSLPVNRLNQYEFLASTESLLYTMKQDIFELSVKQDLFTAGKLKIAIAKTNTTLSQVTNSDVQLPEILDPLFGELNEIISDIMILSDEELTSEGFKSILFKNRLEYVISEFHNYILQLNRESLYRLDLQSLKLISLRNQLTVTFILFIISFIIMIILIQNQMKMLQFLAGANIKIESATKSKSAFLANMSHEIRTPLNAIMGLTYLLTQTKLDRHQIDYLKKINSSAELLLNVINDILDFSKIEAGKLNMEITDFYLEDVLNKLGDTVSMKIDKKNLEFILNTAPETPEELVGDPLRLRQVLLNLVSNAIKFTESGEIIVSVKLLREEEKKVLLQFEVRDTGIGLTKEQIGNLFKAFNQADPSTTRKYGGSGLGLIICKRLVSMMKGKIWLESEPGKGSVFRFTAQFGRHESKRPLPGMWAQNFGNMKALVIDDSKTARTTIKRILESIKLRVVTASSGPEALDIIERETKLNRGFDIIFTDLKMPEMDGLETAQKIREKNPTSRAPVIIMITAYGKKEILDKSFDREINGFITKPVSPSTMLDSIMTAFGKQESLREDQSLQTIKNDDGIISLEGAEVLLAEDNEVNQLVAKELLKSIGIKVTIAQNGSETLELIKKSSFDAILMDVQMPVMDGFTATKRIREMDSPYNTIPIIALTAHAMAGDREKSISAGMDDHLTKPLDPEELFQVLYKWIKSEQENRRTILPPIEPKSTDNFFPEFQGLDANGGLKRIGGNHESYYTLLLNFMERYSRSLIDIAESLKSENRQSTVNKIHTLKGVTGNIGAVELYETLKALEKSVSSDKKKKITSLLEVAENNYTQLTHSIEEILSQRPDQIEPPLLNNNVREAFSELKRLLEENSFNAKETLNNLKKLLLSSDFDREMSSLETHVGRYEFKEAINIVDKILERI